MKENRCLRPTSGSDPPPWTHPPGEGGGVRGGQNGEKSGNLGIFDDLYDKLFKIIQTQAKGGVQGVREPHLNHCARQMTKISACGELSILKGI